jgi:transcriptional repressor NrdR
VSSKVIGEMALMRLAQLDDVAFIRFASVYKDFKDANEFASAIKGLS